ncbi:cytochrome C biogenesis protein [Haloplanus salinus]|jgi:cytochrome c-type biogenesis protein|uniref:Cytochrome C biogenesis protein n=1 Tax=Haloplanus salinus TaxID=1126245 RepID=A0A368NER2_9EURY|nr:cytochrome c biogenesis protein CcdA [Haloplanus salinus]RCU48155.1 cytochrome C biogenesis protein [Haloplanus salinus]
MIDAAFAGTLTFAVGAGLATFFAPCAYPLLPGYVGYAIRDEGTGLGGATVRGLAASAGAVVVLAALGGVLLTVGGRLARHLTLLEPLVGAALVVFGGLVLTDRAPALHLRLPERRASVAGAAVFGGGYALAAAGCVVPVVLGVFTQALTLAPSRAAVALGGYAAATALPLTGVALLSAVGSDALRAWSARVGTIQRLAAVVMIVAGVAQVVASLRYLGVV